MFCNRYVVVHMITITLLMALMNFYELLRTPLLRSIEPIIMHVVVHVGTYIYSIYQANFHSQVETGM